jgi:hypothetical protein
LAIKTGEGSLMIGIRNGDLMIGTEKKIIKSILVRKVLIVLNLAENNLQIKLNQN